MTDLPSSLRVLINREFVSSQRYKDQQMRAVREGAHPDILEFEKRFVTRMRKQHIPLFAHCVWRTKTEQDDAFKRGVSKAMWGDSPHNYGLAVDLIHGTKGWELDPKSWALLGHIGKEIAVQQGIRVTWGGDFRSLYDPAHWELQEWKLAKSVTKPGVLWPK